MKAIWRYKMKKLIFITVITFSFLNAQLSNIRGVVKDKLSGNPVEGAVVIIKDIQLRSVTDRNGRFEIKNISQGKYNLVVEAEGFEISTLENIIIESGEILYVEVELNPKIKETKIIAMGSEKITKREKGNQTAVNMLLSGGLSILTLNSNDVKYWEKTGFYVETGVAFRFSKSVLFDVVISIIGFKFKKEEFLRDYYNLSSLESGNLVMGSFYIDSKIFTGPFYFVIGLGYYISEAAASYIVNFPGPNPEKAFSKVWGQGLSIIYGIGIKPNLFAFSFEVKGMEPIQVFLFGVSIGY
ncbi:Carboxypeptidase regulatory-like domain-containing protein [Candidatus Kryptobacter tengchongensis]|uniref:Carboxypeptidase regulatory-like domain-containing protein n=2 Tax=Kryptobacter tengchongensis TaxID=1643429 RepID=A0A656DAH2_KRYT1|nr:Carboxypeptidase regulatory-like domain-containing protein [Candidatus Kryptobacter tengchongensis]